MDHIYLCPGSSLAECDLVPFDIDEDYRGVPFLGFAKQYQSLVAIQNPLDLTQRQSDRIYQTLFFFSILQEMLGNLFHEEDFIRLATTESPDNEVCVVSTMRLESRLQDLRSVLLTGRSRHQDPGQHLSECFNVSHEIHANLLPEPSRQLKIMVSTCLSQLAAAVHLVTPSSGLKSYPTYSPRDIDITDLDVMVRIGKWCPFEASRAWASCLSFDTAMLLRSFKYPLRTDIHQKCTRDQCQIAFIKEDEYRPGHIDESCTCDFWLNEGEDAATIVESGRLAVISIKLSAQRWIYDIKLVPYDGTAEYIAISHVWSDGLGNLSANVLRSCQICKLVTKVANFLSITLGQESNHMLIWLDTICVPVRPLSAKLKALADMRKAYVQASHVLVFDSFLQTTHFDDESPLICTVKLLTSRWMRRLWTLQEALFARKLYFEYANGFAEYQWLIKKLFESRPMVPHNQYQITTDALHQLRRIRLHKGRLSQYHMQALEVQDLRSAVQSRLVSEKSDEPLCLAAVAGYDVAIPESQPGARMAYFWQQWISEFKISQEIIFNEYPRLAVTGFRWAPSTLLDHHLVPRQKDAANRLHSRGSVAQLVQSGLRVQFPGFLVKPRIEGFEYLDTLRQAWSYGFPNLFMCNAQEAQWFLISFTEHTPELQERLRETNGCALITDASLLIRGHSDGLLVRVDNSHPLTVETISYCGIDMCEVQEAELLTEIINGISWKNLEANATEVRRETWQRFHQKSKLGVDDPPIKTWIKKLYTMLQQGSYVSIEETFDENTVWIVD